MYIKMYNIQGGTNCLVRLEALATISNMKYAFSTKPMISTIVTLAEQTPDLAIPWLYGSRARGTHREDSDYDLAVAFQTFIRDTTLKTKLRPELLAMVCHQSTDNMRECQSLL
jgi:predicted nucleotidyltransferase